MSNAYVIEASDETAGVVVREGQRFRFLSSSPRFWSLDGEYYRSPKEAERAIALLTVRAFAIDEETLDAKTICRFRLALRNAVLAPRPLAAEVPERLFADLQLAAKGVVRQERHTDGRDELAEHPPDAGFTRRCSRGLALFGRQIDWDRGLRQQ